VELVVCITEGIPVRDMMRVYTHLHRDGRTRLVGPNCPGILSPGKANVGIIPAEIFNEGGVGLVSRSGTLTYQIGHELTQLGLGNSTIVGIGGDPVVGSAFNHVLAKFEADEETEIVVMVGEIGGAEEEKAQPQGGPASDDQACQPRTAQAENARHDRAPPIRMRGSIAIVRASTRVLIST
jgi:succinyl-CoA synthetase alpha subunit